MNPNAYIIYSVDDQYYALPVDAVRQIIRSVQTSHLAEAPELLAGLINMGGEIIPVINLRKQFKLPQREISVSDRIIIVQTPTHTVSFMVDYIEGIVEFSAPDITPAADIFPKMEDYILATTKYNDRTVLIYDTGCLFPNQRIEEIMHHLSGAERNS